MFEEQKKILQDVEEKLQQLTIVSESAANNRRSGAMQHMQPVASLRIPNQFYLLLDRKNCLEKLLSASVSKHLDMANAIIEAGDLDSEVKIISTATAVEERLKRESYR